MSERPTPETDALREAIDNGAAVEAEMTSFAMKLERERDEAREALREISEASGFDNIGNWARNKANDALNNKN